MKIHLPVFKILISFLFAHFLSKPTCALGKTLADPIVSTTIVDPSMVENSDNGSITFSLPAGSVATSDITINYSVLNSSTATAGLDYSALPGTMIIPAGQNNVSIAVISKNDKVAELTEFIEVQLVNGIGYVVDNSADRGQLQINEDPNDLILTVVATEPAAREGGQTGEFKIQLPPGITAATNISFNYSVSGDAISGADYLGLTLNTIPVGANGVLIPVNAYDDAFFDPQETVILTLTPSADYTIGANSSATVYILDPFSIPIATDGPVIVNEDDTYGFVVSDFKYSDLDGDPLVKVIINSLTDPAKGKLLFNGSPVIIGQEIPASLISQLTYQPAKDQSEPNYDQFDFLVSDGVNTSTEAYTITINVLPVNDPQVVSDKTVTTAQEAPITVDLRSLVTDIDNSNFTFSSSNSTVTINPVTGELVYTPENGFVGTDQITFEVCDDSTPKQCDQGIISVVVSPGIADVSVSKSTSELSIDIFEEFEYTIVAENKDNITATNVTVTDKLSDDLVFASVSSSQAGFDPQTRMVTWNVGTLSPGTNTTLSLKVYATRGGDISNSAEIKALQTDPDPKNGSSTALKKVNELHIPNVFTPNGDNKNDTFVIEGADTLSLELQVMNRWGNEVFVSNKYLHNWDGSNLPDGTYFYVLRAYSPDGKQKAYKGYITIIRKQ